MKTNTEIREEMFENIALAGGNTYLKELKKE